MREEMADQVAPVLTYVFHILEKLRGQSESLDLKQVQGVLKGLLSGDVHPPLWADFGGEGRSAPSATESFLGVRYALVCLLDELFVFGSPWSEAWNASKLEWALFQTSDRAWKFWAQAQLADGRLGADALEVFLVCVFLGFRGNLRDQPERLAEWVHSARARLARRPAGPGLVLAEGDPAPAFRPLREDQRWLWRLLGPPQESTEHPTVDAAWEDGWQAVREADVEPTATPLFLVLGSPVSGEGALFEAAFPDDPSRWRVRQAPAYPDAPLHVSATRDAIYVSWPGAFDRPALHQHDRDLPSGNALEAAGRPGEAYATIAVSPQALHGYPRGPEAGRRDRGRRHPPSRSRGADVEGKLRRLCRLLARDRRGNAPVNGVLVLVPYAATDSDESARRVALAIRRELAIVREATRLSCPVFALLCDVEQAPGFVDFVERLPAGQRHNRLGQSFPWHATSDPAEGARRIAAGMDQVCREVIPGTIRELWDTKGDPGRANRQLYRFTCQLRERRQRLVTLVTASAQAFEDGPSSPSGFGGFYFAGTGTKADEQAFVAGVFEKLFERRKYLVWTRAAVDEDRQYRRWYASALGALAALLLLMAGVVWLV
jgi:hypothetical protein